MKSLFSLFALLTLSASLPAWASEGARFVCKTDRLLAFEGNEEIRPAKYNLSFGVKNLATPSKWELVSADGSTDSETPVQVRPSESPLDSLNENARLRLRTTSSDQRLEIQGDSDGLFSVTLSLSRSSGYTRGYVRVVDSGAGVGSAYGSVTCKVSPATR